MYYLPGIINRGDRRFGRLCQNARLRRKSLPAGTNYLNLVLTIEKYACILPVIASLDCDTSNTTILSKCLCLNVHAEEAVTACVQDTCKQSDQDS